MNMASANCAPGERPLAVLLAGELPVQSAPSLTLASALGPHGFRSFFSEDQESISTAGWLRLVRRADVIVYVGYNGPEPYIIRQLALAVVHGKPVIRWWVGTDVLRCVESVTLARCARLLGAMCAKQVACAPHLQSELAGIGIQTKVIPSVTNSEAMRLEQPAGPLPRGVLVYLPTAKGPFYGEETVGRIIRANPDLRFTIIADERHRFRSCPNVESLGWVQDMKPLYDRIGCLLRITRHDGLPRMVLEALLMGKYVICSQAVPGCWVAKDFEDIQTYLRAFRNCSSVNAEGADSVRTLLNPPPDVQFASLLRGVVDQRQVRTSFRAALALAPLTLISRIIGRASD